MTSLHRANLASRGAAQRWVLAGLVAAVFLLPAMPASALKEEQRQAVRRQIDSVKAWQLTRDLGLSEDQARIFVPAHRDYLEQKEQLRIQREDIETELESLVGGRGGPEREIAAKLEQMKYIDRQIEANEGEFRRKRDRILSPEQEARYALFEKRFNAQLREMIRDIQRGDQERSAPEKGR